MARRRNLSTEISTDKRVNQLSDFATLLYTWLLIHSEDDASFTADPQEINLKVFPGRQKDLADIEKAINEIARSELIQLANDGRLYFPLAAFYKHQNYIPTIKRAKATENRRLLIFKAAADLPKSAASPSLTPSPSLSLKKDAEPAGPVLVDNYDSKIKDLFGVIHAISRSMAKDVASWAGRQKQIGNSERVIYLTVEKFAQRIQAGFTPDNTRGYLTDLEKHLYREDQQAESGRYKNADLSGVGSILARIVKQ